MSRDDFQSIDYINLQPRSVKNKFSFWFPAASTASGRGSIPYGTTITDVAVSAFNEDGTDVTSSMITVTPSVADSYYVYLGLSWVSAGLYKLVFKLTISDASTWEYNFNRVVCEDL